MGCLDRVVRIRDCRIIDVHYNPGRHCCATYLINYQAEGKGRDFIWYGKCFDLNRFEHVFRRVASNAWICSSRDLPYVILQDEGIVLLAYPNDRKLRGLNIFESEKSLLQFLNQQLSQHWSPSEIELKTTVVRYRPEDRAVVKCEIVSTSESRTLYLRIYSNARATRHHELMNQLFSGLQADIGVARPLGYSQEQKIIIVEHLSGVTLSSLLEKQLVTASLAIGPMRKTAEGLARLHCWSGAVAVESSIADYLARGLHAIDQIKLLAPQFSIEKIGHALQSQAPNIWTYGFVHGDFQFDQVLIDANSVSFLDFDSAHTGAIESDLGNVFANLRARRLEKGWTDVSSLSETFLDSYCSALRKPLNQQSISWWTALSLVQKAAKRIRRLQSESTAVAAELLQEAQSLLCSQPSKLL
jgi:aminoglycoside phosphotransferase (APT) family kinase protein